MFIHFRQSNNPIRDFYYAIDRTRYPQLEKREYLALSSLLYAERFPAATVYLRNRGFTNPQIVGLINEFQNFKIQEFNSFGIMNYSFSLPVSFQVGKLNILLNYTYNIPISLPKEQFSYDPNGYFSASVSYMLFWQGKKRSNNYSAGRRPEN